MAEPTTEIPYCYTCPYWDVSDYSPARRDSGNRADDETIEGFILRLTEADEGVHATCRRHAPRFADIHPDDRDDDDLASWPRTANFDWCGEHPDFPAYLYAWRARPDAARRGGEDTDA